ncbi:unnamed protein product [Amoebophrya sp. A120]|nr:unnamed protein product [Amoebophrya sp. A120]|eukprot:GSA120T00005538001.1
MPASVDQGYVWSGSAAAWLSCRVVQSGDAGILVRYSTKLDSDDDWYEKFLTPAAQRRLFRTDEPTPDLKAKSGDSFGSAEKRDSGTKLELAPVLPTRKRVISSVKAVPVPPRSTEDTTKGPQSSGHAATAKASTEFHQPLSVPVRIVPLPGNFRSGSSSSSSSSATKSNDEKRGSGGLEPVDLPGGHGKSFGTSASSSSSSKAPLLHVSTTNDGTTPKDPPLRLSLVKDLSRPRGRSKSESSTGTVQLYERLQQDHSARPSVQEDVIDENKVPGSKELTGDLARLVLKKAFELGDPTEDLLSQADRCANGFQVHGVLYKVRSTLQKHDRRIAALRQRLVALTCSSDQQQSSRAPPEKISVSPVEQQPPVDSLGGREIDVVVKDDEAQEVELCSSAEQRLAEEKKEIKREANRILFQLAGLKERLAICKAKTAPRFPQYNTAVQEISTLQTLLEYSLGRCQGCKVALETATLKLMPNVEWNAEGDKYTLHLCPNPGSNFPMFVPDIDGEVRGKRGSFTLQRAGGSKKSSPKKDADEQGELNTKKLGSVRREQILNAKDEALYDLYSGIDESQKYPYHCKFQTTDGGHSVLILGFDYGDPELGKEQKFGEVYNMFGETVAELFLFHDRHVLTCQLVPGIQHYDPGLVMMAAVLVGSAVPPLAKQSSPKK